jgi:hypothetical protein
MNDDVAGWLVSVSSAGDKQMLLPSHGLGREHKRHRYTITIVSINILELEFYI